MSYLITFLPRGQGRFRFLPLGPLATPITPLKRSLREGYGTVRRVYTAPKSCPRLWGKWHGEAMTKGEYPKSCQVILLFPLSRLRRHLPRFTVAPLGCVLQTLMIKQNRGTPLRPPISFNILLYPLCLSVPLASSSSSFAAGSLTLARNIMAAIMYGLKLACL